MSLDQYIINKRKNRLNNEKKMLNFDKKNNEEISKVDVYKNEVSKTLMNIMKKFIENLKFEL